MCKAIEDMLKETAARVTEEIAVRMLSDGISVEDAAKYSQLSVEEIKKLQANQMRQQGIHTICKAIEDMLKETAARVAKEAAEEIAVRMLSTGRYGIDEVSDISGLSQEKVKKLQADRLNQ